MGGLHRAFERAYSLRCSTFQIFTTNPRGWKQREVSQEEVGAFLEESKRTGIDLYFSHIPYLANFAAEGEIFEKSVHMLHAELQRSFKLKIAGVVVHVGKLKGKAYKEGIRKIARGIDLAMEGTEDVLVLLENTAGQGTEVGYRLEHLQDIMETSVFPERLGLCIDTAHAFEAGYPIHTTEGLEAFFKEIDERFGLQKLKLIHLNDSKTSFASRVDRHWHIGEGQIGLEGFKIILSHPIVRSVPMVMETPWGEEWDRRNMRRVRELLGLPV